MVDLDAQGVVRSGDGDTILGDVDGLVIESQTVQCSDDIASSITTASWIYPILLNLLVNYEWYDEISVLQFEEDLISGS
jgi:hypothetical protein